MVAKQLQAPSLYRIRYRLADDPDWIVETLLPVGPGESARTLAEARFGPDAVLSIDPQRDATPPVARFLHGRFHAMAPQDEPLLQGLCS